MQGLDEEDEDQEESSREMGWVNPRLSRRSDELTPMMS